MKVLKNKTDVLRDFAKRVPNAETMAIDYGRDTLTVFFDGIHSQEYKASEIIKKFENGAASQGVTVIWE